MKTGLKFLVLGGMLLGSVNANAVVVNANALELAMQDVTYINKDCFAAYVAESPLLLSKIWRGCYNCVFDQNSKNSKCLDLLQSVQAHHNQAYQVIQEFLQDEHYGISKVLNTKIINDQEYQIGSIIGYKEDKVLGVFQNYKFLCAGLRGTTCKASPESELVFWIDSDGVLRDGTGSSKGDYIGNTLLKNPNFLSLGKIKKEITDKDIKKFDIGTGMNNLVFPAKNYMDEFGNKQKIDSKYIEPPAFKLGLNED